MRNPADQKCFEPAAVPSTVFVEFEEIESLVLDDEARAIERYLAPAEQVCYAGLKTQKRRIGWRAGRIAAKRLIRETFFAGQRAIVPYAAIGILADDMGAPQVYIAGEPGPWPRVSITHGAGVSAAYRSPRPELRPGIDVEMVERREPAFVAQFFTPGERARAAFAADIDVELTKLWTVKEAVLKALGIGGRVDFREIDIDAAGSGVSLRGEARRHAEAMGATDPTIELECEDCKCGRRVVARVLLRVES